MIGPAEFSAGDIAARNAGALAAAGRLVARPNTTAARAIWRYNHVLGYGQSLSSGWEGWPALSTIPRHDSLMIGDSVRPAMEGGPRWHPVGGPALRPLRATTQACRPDQPATEMPGVMVLGETVLEGAVNFYRARQLQAAGMPADPAHLLLASSCGVAGRSLAALSRGAAPELFNRLRECAAAARALAAPESYGILALLCLQGEQDSLAGTPRQDYRAALQQLYTDFRAEVAGGQAEPPAMFTYQTGGGYARDTGRLAIGMAQLDAALSLPDWFLVAPAYPVTNRVGGHLDANGHRWLGVQFGKVMHRVLTLGETWRPLHPTMAEQRGRSILLQFHVPCPPLAFDLPYHLTARLPVANHGFRVTDAAGGVTLTGVELAAATLVRLTLSRSTVGEVLCWYADATEHGGYGGLRDSDATVSDEVYEAHAGAGVRLAAHGSELLGRPYPLWNWCVGFVTAVGASSLVAQQAGAGPLVPAYGNVAAS